MRLGAALACVTLAACEPTPVDLLTRPRDVWVSPTGDDANGGLSPHLAVRSIDAALARAFAGTTVHLLPGVYDQDVATVRAGRADAPIVITGPRDAVVRGAGSARVFEINHDHHVLQGFTIDGLAGDPGSASAYRDKLVFVLGRTPRVGLRGIVLRGLRLQNAAGECVRLRYFVQQSVVEDNDIGPCGVADFQFGGAGENGQGVYVGTALDQLNDGKNPTADRDASTGNVIRKNRIETRGAECISLKEAADGNRVQDNLCTGVARASIAGLDVRSNGNTVASNVSFGHPGAALRLGGETAGDGVSNTVTGNELRDNAGAAIRITRGPQAHVCGNRVERNAGGVVEGPAADGVDPTAPCP